MASILDVIEREYDKLSKKQRILADYIRDNLQEIPFITISEFSERSGVSLASITRFSKRLGYSGYHEFQGEVSTLVRKDLIPMKQIRDIIESQGEEDILEENISHNIHLLENLFSENLRENFQSALEAMKGSRKIYVCGSRSSYSVAYYIYFMLRNFIEEVELLSNDTSDISNKLKFVRPEDTLITISYHRYTKFTCDVTDYFHRSGCRVISITDSYSSPVALRSSSILLTKNVSDRFSFVSTMTVANSLITAFGRLMGEDAIESIDRQNEIAFLTETYI